MIFVNTWSREERTWRRKRGVFLSPCVSFSPPLGRGLGENLIKPAGSSPVPAFTNYRSKWSYIMQHLHSDNYAARF